MCTAVSLNPGVCHTTAIIPKKSKFNSVRYFQTTSHGSRSLRFVYYHDKISLK